MRVDHIAYQRGTRVAWFGFLLQALIGLVLLGFALTTGDRGDTTILFAALAVLAGLVVWLSLAVVFHQHKLERLEALEEDEFAARESGTIFEGEGARVAARRLEKMHKWMMPGASLLLAGMLVLLGLWMAGYMRAVFARGVEASEARDLALTPALGWAVAICLSLAAVSFIFSRFVAGMAKQAAWQNLRGGAGYMVGNSVILFAVAAGVIFRFFDNDAVIHGVAVAIPILLGLLAVEIVINFILNLYRPRIPGEVPRPAFDSRVLSLLAAPDSFVRTINEAVNYQFGFDVTSTWGYQLLMRSVVKLVAIGLVALVVLSTMQVVEPNEQAVKLAFGRIVGDRVHDSGLMWKLPWPLQGAEAHDVARVRELPLTARRVNPHDQRVSVWLQKREGRTDRDIEPLLVRASRVDSGGTARRSDGALSESVALVDAEVVLQYRIKADGGGLLDYLRFAPDTLGRRDSLTLRERILRDIALRELTLELAGLSLDEALAGRRGDLVDALQVRIQAAFDRHRTGIELVAVTVPLLRPYGSAVQNFEDLAMATQDLELIQAEAQRSRLITLAYLVGDPAAADEVVAAIDAYNARSSALGPGAPETIEARETAERLLLEAGGNAGQQIAEAYTDRSVELLSTRARAVRLAGQTAAYRAAPELYRQRELMRVYRDGLSGKRIYLIGIDPDRVQMDVELQQLNPVLDFESSIEPGQGDES